MKREWLKGNPFKTLFIIIMLICLGYYLNRYVFVHKEYEYVPDLGNLPQPVQYKAEGGTHMKVNDLEATIAFKAHYSISGRVVDIQTYGDYKDFNVMAPVDFGMVWGPFAKDEYQKRVTWSSYGTRFLSFYTSDSRWTGEIGGMSAVQSMFSNNHLIPADDAIKKQIDAIKKNQYVKLEGYLVTVYASSPTITYAPWESSLTRLDSGDGACEIMYVEKVVWLKQEKK